MSGVEKDILNFIANFGETIILLLPLAAICFYVATHGALRLATAWFCAFILCAAIAGGLKAIVWPVSGHADISLAFYGGLAALLWRTAGHPSSALRALVLTLVGVVALVTWSVWMLSWHPIKDIAAGLLVGSLSPLVIFMMPGRALLSRRAPFVAVLIALLLILPLHGLRLNYAYAAGKVIRTLDRI